MSKKNAIQGFIQNIYAFVIGFGFFQIRVSDVNFSAAVDWEIIFNIALYLFTFTLAAHDWLEYHKRDLTDKMNFVRALPQMLSLLSIGFMFLHSTYDDLLLWSMGGIALTICNFAGVYADATDKKEGWDRAIALGFIALSAGSFFFIIGVLYRNGGLGTFKPQTFWWLISLAILVYGLWILKYFQFGKTRDQQTFAARKNELDNRLLSVQTGYDKLIEECTAKKSEVSASIAGLGTLKDELGRAISEIDKQITLLKAKIPTGG